MGVVALGRAGEALVAVSVGAGLAHQAPGGTSRDPGLVRIFVDGAGAFFAARPNERFGHSRAVKNAVHHDRPLAVGLAAQLGTL